MLLILFLILFSCILTTYFYCAIFSIYVDWVGLLSIVCATKSVSLERKTCMCFGYESVYFQL